MRSAHDQFAEVNTPRVWGFQAGPELRGIEWDSASTMHSQALRAVLTAAK